MISLFLEAQCTLSMMRCVYDTISAPPKERMILSAHAESIITSAGGAKQQSTKSCRGKCSNNGSGRGNSGSGNKFDVGSGDDCSDNSSSNGVLENVLKMGEKWQAK